jgi:hypothetical protein
VATEAQSGVFHEDAIREFWKVGHRFNGDAGTLESDTVSGMLSGEPIKVWVRPIDGPQAVDDAGRRWTHQGMSESNRAHRASL